VHLLCHLDSPSAASLPYLGLQEQTGPEVSGLYGSYRVPSRSSLLPLCTLSPGGVAHRPTSLTQSNTAWSQQPTGNIDKCFPKWFSSHRIIPRDDFGTGSTHRLAQLPRITKILPLNSAQASRSGNAHTEFLRDRHRLHAHWTGCTWFPPGKHRPSFFCNRSTRRSLVDWLTRLSLRQSDPMAGNPPHDLLCLFYLHAPGLTLVTLETACIPSVHLPPTTWEITGPSKRT
jgi:hypothetical protein